METAHSTTQYPMGLGTLGTLYVNINIEPSVFKSDILFITDRSSIWCWLVQKKCQMFLLHTIENFIPFSLSFMKVRAFLSK